MPGSATAASRFCAARKQPMDKPDTVLLPPPWSHILGLDCEEYTGLDQARLLRLVEVIIEANGGEAPVIETEVGDLAVRMETHSADNRWRDPIYHIVAADWRLTMRYTDRYERESGYLGDNMLPWFNRFLTRFKNGRIDGIGFDGDRQAFARDIGRLVLFGVLPTRPRVSWDAEQRRRALDKQRSAHGWLPPIP